MEVLPSSFTLFRKTSKFNSWNRCLGLTNIVFKKIMNANLENVFTFLNCVTLYRKSRTIIFYPTNQPPAKLGTAPVVISVPNWQEQQEMLKPDRARQPVILQRSVHSEYDLLQHTEMSVLALPTAKEHMRNTADLPKFFKSLRCIVPHARTIEN